METTMTLSRKTGISAALAVALAAAAVTLPVMTQARGMPGMGDGPGMMLNFDQFDADKDGKVTEAEVAAFRTNMVAGADADKDGLLSVEELTAHEVKMIEAMAAQHAARRIADQDTNGDGKLSAEEMLAAPLPTAIFDKMDADGDGAVTQAEFDEARAQMQENGRGMGHGRGGMGHGFFRGGHDAQGEGMNDN
jgi:Ca2+-binding EF-hand superfamily protein